MNQTDSSETTIQGLGLLRMNRPVYLGIGRHKMFALYLLTAFLMLLSVGCSTLPWNSALKLSEGFDHSAGNVPCYIVNTPTVTYFLEKEGGGLSSMIDRDGADWLGFHKESGSESKGEYRGFPNAIHQQDGNYFHARNAATQWSTAVVEVKTAQHIRIVFTSANQMWQGQWDFYPDYCNFTMTEVSPGYKYWILYEGVPGGELDKTDFWYSSASNKKHSIDERQNFDLPGPEWMAFGDEKSTRMVYLLSSENDTYPDRFYNMRDEMTVFGFGRARGYKFLQKPITFSIGFVEATDYHEVSRYVRRLAGMGGPTN